MNIEKSHFSRNLLIVMALLFVLTQAAMIYPTQANDPSRPEWWMIALNMLILSIPLTLLYGSSYMVIMAWREHAVTGQVEPRLAKIIHWAPRIAAILIILFISLFSLDVFETQASPLEVLGGLLVHNIPSIALIVLLAFSWKRPAVGFVAFLVAGALFTLFFVRDFYALSNLLFFVLPILLIACLFYIDWKWLGAAAPAASGLAS
jgi:hypothetical protein